MVADDSIHSRVNQNQALHQTIHGPVSIGATYLGPRGSAEQLQLSKPTFPVHSLNVQKNEEFICRETELRILHGKLVASERKDSRPLSCVIHGFGGVGKTQMALAFAYEYLETFDAVFWISADPEKPTEFRRTYGAIGRKLGLISVTTIEEAEVEIIRNWLETEGKRNTRFSLTGS